MDKKKIIAIILFILLGLFIFTFANPGPSELDPVEVPGQGEVDDEESNDEESNDEEETEDDETDRPVVEVDEAPIIEINPRSVTILFGQNYNVMTGVKATDDNDVVSVTASITDTTKLEVGTHTITYTTSDRSGHTTTATRTIVVLDPIGDNDNDGYTNEEEIENGTNPDDGEEYPEYSKNPSIDFSSCATSMTVYGEVINFEECVKVNDEFYGTEGVTTEITSDINPNQIGNYTVTIVAKDNLGNETTETFEFEVLKRDVTVTIDNIDAIYKDEVKPLTSNAEEMAYNGNDIGVILSTEVTNTTPTGKYPITGTWTNENYNVTFVDGVYSISSKTLTEEDIKELGIEFKDDTFIYNGTAQYLSVNNLPKEFNVTYNNNGKVNVGTYEVEAIITGNENYNGTITLKATMTITPKEVSVKWNETTFTYNGEKQIPTATAEGVEISIAVKAGNSIDAGTYTAVAVTSDATIKPIYLEQQASGTYAYILKPQYVRPLDGEGYPTDYYYNALEDEEGNKVSLTINVSGLTEEQVNDIRNGVDPVIIGLGEEEVFKYLAQSTKDALNEINHGVDEGGAYTIEWYVLKYQADGWHLDGHKVYDKTVVTVSKDSWGIFGDKVNINFNNAVTNLKVEVNGKEKDAENGAWNDKVGNEWYVLTSNAKTVKVTYTVNGIEYTETFNV